MKSDKKVKTIAEKIAKISGKDIKIKYDEKKPTGPLSRTADSDILPVINDGASYEARLVVVGSESNEVCSSR